MEFKKLNIGWDADPNSPMPIVIISHDLSCIKVLFYLNYFIHDDVSEDDIGLLVFKDCYKFRLGSTNDEGFYRGQCRFSKSGISWGDFYQLFNSNWENDFPKDEKIVNGKFKESMSTNHFLFYFRDETFECISAAYNFSIVKEDYYKKYENGRSKFFYEDTESC